MYQFSGVSGFGKNTGYPAVDSHPRMLADVNGDGRADVVGFAEDGIDVALGTRDPGWASPTRWSTHFGRCDSSVCRNQNYQPRVVGDLDGDGRADVVQFGFNFGSGFRYMLADYGSTPAFSAMANGPSDWPSNNTFCGNSNECEMGKYPRFVADVNGDARGDIVGIGAAGVYVALAIPRGAPFGGINGFEMLDGDAVTSGIQPIVTHFGTNHGFTDMHVAPRVLADISGDGRMDIVGFHPDGVEVAVSLGRSFTYSTSLRRFGSNPGAGGWTNQTLFPRFVVDVNGDGLADLVGMKIDAIYVSLSFGQPDGTGPATNRFIGPDPISWVTIRTGSPLHEHTRHFFPADLNGDGRSDFVVVNNGSFLSAVYSRGNSFQIQEQYHRFSPYDWGVPTSRNFSYFVDYPLASADLNGDGKGDLAFFGPNEVVATFASMNGFPDVLTSSSNGIGATLHVQYGTPSQMGSITTSVSGLRIPNTLPKPIVFTVDVANAIPTSQEESNQQASAPRTMLYQFLQPMA